MAAIKRKAHDADRVVSKKVKTDGQKKLGASHRKTQPLGSQPTERADSADHTTEDDSFEGFDGDSAITDDTDAEGGEDVLHATNLKNATAPSKSSDNDLPKGMS